MATIKGTMAPAAFAALPDAAKADAWLKGDVARLPSDFEGESAEETAKYITEHLGFQGFDALREFMRRIPVAKLGIKIAGIAVSDAIADWFVAMSPFPPETKTKFALLGRNVLQGVLAAMIDASDPDKGHREIDKAISVAKYVEAVDATDPDAVKVVLWVDPASRVRMILKAVVETVPGSNAKRYRMIPDTNVPATESKIVEGRYAAFAAANRRETVTTGGKGGGGGTKKVVDPPAFNEAELIPLSSARAMADAVWPSADWPEGRPAPAAPAPKAAPWHERIDATGTALYDALILFPTTTTSKVDDIVGGELGKHAAKMEPAEWNKLAADILTGSGVYADCWQPADADHAEGLTEKGFNLVVGRINARVPGANIPLARQAEIAAHTLWDKLSHAWEHKTSWSVWKPALASLLIVLADIGFAGWILYRYWKGWAGSDDVTDPIQAYKDEVWSLTVACFWMVLWFIQMYFGEWIEKGFQGLVHSHNDEHGHSSLSNTARLTTALLLGLASVVTIVKTVSLYMAVGSFPLMYALLAVPMATVSADRLSARWVDGHEESILHQAVHIAHSRIQSLNWIGTGLIALVVTIGVAVNYLDGSAKFVAVIVKDADTGAFYVPTPRGTVFRPEDVLGEVEAAKQEAGITAGQKPICLAAGSVFDLPGYTEKEVAVAACAGTGYAMRTNLLGSWRYEREAAEYHSIAELAAASKPTSAAPATVSAPAPVTTPPAPAPVVARPAPARPPTESNTYKLPCYMTGGC